MTIQWSEQEHGMETTRYTGADGFVYEFIQEEGWYVVSAVLFREDPKYNGPHICPRCGSKSQWRGTDAKSRMISVQCEGGCREYNMSFSQLSDYPKFKEGQI